MLAEDTELIPNKACTLPNRRSANYFRDVCVEINTMERFLGFTLTCLNLCGKHKPIQKVMCKTKRSRVLRLMSGVLQLDLDLVLSIGLNGESAHTFAGNAVLWLKTLCEVQDNMNFMPIPISIGNQYKNAQ